MTDEHPIRGTVHGRTIQLVQDTGLPDGEPVAVTVRPLLKPGEGIRRSAGGWSDADEELDEWLASMRRSRDEQRAESA